MEVDWNLKYRPQNKIRRKNRRAKKTNSAVLLNLGCKDSQEQKRRIKSSTLPTIKERAKTIIIRSFLRYQSTQARGIHKAKENFINWKWREIPKQRMKGRKQRPRHMTREMFKPKMQRAPVLGLLTTNTKEHHLKDVTQSIVHRKKPHRRIEESDHAGNVYNYGWPGVSNDTNHIR